MARVVMYSRQACSYCRHARSLLTQRGIDFEELDVSHDIAKRRWLVEATGGRRTLPQIFIDDRSIGGYDELSALDRAGGLEHLLPPATKGGSRAP